MQGIIVGGNINDDEFLIIYNILAGMEKFEIKEASKIYFQNNF